MNHLTNWHLTVQLIILLKLFVLLVIPVLSQAQTAGWVHLEHTLGEIRSVDVGPDGRLYVLEYSGESIEYPTLSFSLPLCNLHISDDNGETLERIATRIAAVPPIFLPGGDVLVSFYGVWTYPDWAYHWVYPDYLDSDQRHGEFESIWYHGSEYIHASQNPTGLFALASRFIGSSRTEDNGLLWIYEEDGGVDRRLFRMGGVRDAAVSDDGVVFFAESERTDYGIINVYFCSTGDRGETVDTLYDRLLVERFVLTPDKILLAEASPHDPDVVGEDMNDRSIYRSADGGRSWDVALPGAEAMRFKVVDSAYYLIARVYGELPGYRKVLLVSTDQGNSWNERYEFAEGGVDNFQITDEGEFFVLRRGVVVGSLDRGESWINLPGPFAFGQYIILPDGGIVAHAGSEGMYRLAYPLTIAGPESRFEKVDLNLW